MNFQNNNAFAGFGAFPAANGFQNLFNDAAGRTEQAAKRSRQAAEELADMARGNVDAVVEASRIAATGAQSIGQNVIAKSRDNLELAADTVRSMTEAKNPADLLQLQANFLRGSFDRFVEESATLTESMVKLAGEAFQPISNAHQQERRAHQRPGCLTPLPSPSGKQAAAAPIVGRPPFFCPLAARRALRRLPWLPYLGAQHDSGSDEHGHRAGTR